MYAANSDNKQALRTKMTKRILIIDDDDDFREVVQICLDEIAGWSTVGCASGSEGLARAQADLPDAILLDMMMPGEDGMAILARLQAEPPTAAIPIILLTAKAQTARHPPSGPAGVILKPFDPLRLGSEIAEMLGWPPPAGNE
jgi:CheY-like chemotaxis protein